MGGKRKGTGYAGNVFESPSPILGQPWQVPALADLPPIPPGVGFGCYYQPNASVGVPLVPSYRPCDPGYFCPYVVDQVMLLCPPSPECFMNRLAGGSPCLPQGRFEPALCPAGFYCPTPSTIHPCPEGHYCVTGTTQPTPCQFMSSCPTGTITETHFGTLLIVLLADVLLCIVFYCQSVYERRRDGASWIDAATPTFLQGRGRRRRPKTTRKDAECSRSSRFGRLNARTAAADKYSGTRPTQVRAATATIAAGADAARATTSTFEEVSVLVQAFRDGFNGDERLRMHFAFDNLTLALPTGKVVLGGVTGGIRAGHMTAIMGGSGAGKTTFMNVLMGKVQRTGGALRINDEVDEIHNYRNLIGFVPQDDTMLRVLTVREAVLHSARMRLPSSWPASKVAAHVDNLLRALNLSSVAHTRIGDEVTRGISGGQRKRVNIALELVAAPLALFLDEPTSGLDATASLDVVDILQAVSKLGVTVVSIIHQPRIEIFERFDDVLLLAPGGRTAYFGPIARAKDYFTSLGFRFDSEANPADVLMDIVSGRGQRADPDREVPVDLASQWVSSGSTVHVDLSTTTTTESGGGPTNKAMRSVAARRGATWLQQAFHCHNRSLLKQSRELTSLQLELFCAFLAGFLMGNAVTGNVESFYGLTLEPYALISLQPDGWLIAMYGMLAGMSVALSAAPSGVNVFGEDLPVYWRETASGQSPSAYYVGTSISVLWRIVLSAAHFTAIYYVLARPTFAVGLQYLMILLNVYCVYGISACISMITSRGNMALVSVVTTSVMAFNCGFLVTLNRARDAGFEWAFDLGPNRWMAEAQFALTLNTYEGVYNLASEARKYGYDLDAFANDMLVMVALGIAYRVVAYVFMVTAHRDKQK
ncbi:ABC transporter domain-containing protein [Plasmodiophora brassicae]